MLITIQIEDVAVSVADDNITIEEVENAALDIWKKTRVSDKEEEILN